MKRLRLFKHVTCIGALAMVLWPGRPSALEWSWTGAASTAYQLHFSRDTASGGLEVGNALASQAGLKSADFELEHIHLAMNVALNDRFDVSIAPCIEHEGTLSIRTAYLEAIIWERDFETLLSAEVGRFLVPFGKFNYLAEVTNFPSISRPMMFASHDQDIIIFQGFPHPVFMSQYSEIGLALSGNKWLFDKHQIWYAAWAGNGLYQEGFTGHKHGGTVGHIMAGMGLAKSQDAGHDSAGFSLPVGTYNGVSMTATDIAWLQKTRFSTDNNANKAAGGRLSYAFREIFSVGASYMFGFYDPAGLLEYSALGFDAGLDLETKIGGIHLTGEYVRAPTDYAAYNDTASMRINIGTYVTSGYYGQLVYRFRKKWEVVGMYDVLRRDGPETKYVNGLPLLETGAENETTMTTKVSGGINFSPIENVKIKTEYAFYQLDYVTMGMSLGRVHRLSTALVLSF